MGGNLIVPGRYGIGTRGIVPTRKGYCDAASALIDEYRRLGDRFIATADRDTVDRVLRYHGVQNMRELYYKFGR